MLILMLYATKAASACIPGSYLQHILGETEVHCLVAYMLEAGDITSSFALLLVIEDGCPDNNIGHQALVGQLAASLGRGGVVPQPHLHGSAHMCCHQQQSLGLPSSPTSSPCPCIAHRAKWHAMMLCKLPANSVSK